MSYNIKYDFTPWLNERIPGVKIISWEKLGLKPDAPPEAVDAYEDFCKVMEEAKRKGEKL